LLFRGASEPVILSAAGAKDLLVTPAAIGRPTRPAPRGHLRGHCAAPLPHHGLQRYVKMTS